MTQAQTPGRKANAAEPLGEKQGVSSNREVEETGAESTRRAGPDGPRAETPAALQAGGATRADRSRH